MNYPELKPQLFISLQNLILYTYGKIRYICAWAHAISHFISFYTSPFASALNEQFTIILLVHSQNITD